MLNIPGVVAVHLYYTLPNSAEVFPRLAGDVLPAALTGLIAAVIFGAAITSINAGLNSASTLFVLNIYKPLLQKKQKQYTDHQLIKIGKHFKVFATLVAICIAPFIAFAEDGFYTWIQKVGGAFSVPIFTILLIGFITRRVPAIAAKIGLVFFVSTYLFTQTIWDTGLHFLHVLAILFMLTCTLMLLIGKIWPQPIAYKIIERGTVSLQPWRMRHLFYLLLMLGLIGLYWLFSPWGIAA
jgi:solute:Na+ symporter, SSS family